MTAPRSLSTSLRHLNRTLLSDTVAELPDAELVGLFVERRDEAAFTALVRRHGTLVLGVCRRVLRHEQDAEDAFQATFLVFARDAANVRRAAGVSNWLYGVAYNVARRAKTARNRRERKEHVAATRQDAETPPTMANDLREILDAELNALPDKYRAPIVLCDLGGLTTQEAAAEVGCLPKTLGTRLGRGRTLLARRLTRRGLALPAGGLLAVLAPGSATAAPLLLVETTVHAAIGFATGSAASVAPAVLTLIRGVSNLMLVKTLKCVAVLTCGLLAVGGLTKHMGSSAHATAGGGNGAAGSRAAVRQSVPVDPLQHVRLFLDHVDNVMGQIGLGPKGVGADDKKDKDDKPKGPAGTWVQKEGELKIEFGEKGAMSISPHGENKVIVILCECTAEKDGVVKAKVTGFEGKEDAIKMVMEKIPIGTEFSFKWKVKDAAATLSEVKGDESKVELLKSRLESDYEKK